MITNSTRVTFENGTTIEVDKGTSLYELSRKYQPEMKHKIVGAEINNEVVPLDYRINKESKVIFLDSTYINGYKLAKAGLEFIIEVALKEEFGRDYEVEYDYSILSEVYMTIKGPKKFTLNDAKRLKSKMNEIVANDEIIQRLNVDKKEAMAYYTKVDCNEKAKNIHNTSKEIVRVYKLRNYINYFYSGMPYSTGALEDFNLVFLSDNKLVLIFNAKSGSKNEYVLYKNVIEQYDIGKKWIKDMDIPYLADVNHLISELKMENLVKAIETNYNNQLSHVAREVLDKKAKYVLIAGPSSSGKTTSTKKLSLQLRSRGYDTLLISADNYFKDVAEHNKPKEEIDFEAIDCLDLKLLGKQLKDLVAGKKVSLPEYNFALGVKEYNDPPVSITEDTIILIEGLHAINDKMTPDLDPSKKFKIFLSPLMPLNIDKHNYISINDLRLMRRIVRDNRTRATDVGQTISYWNIVRNGEEKNIYPFVNGVDRVLNTSLAYEVGVLKVFVLPLLYSVTEESLAYTEARRIIESLDEFYPIPSDYVPDDSILREFIGKSIFESYK